VGGLALMDIYVPQRNPPREPAPGELVRCCPHLHGDVVLRRPYSWAMHWECLCCGITWHWTAEAPSSRVIPC
jgi:hypothetical protein